MAPFSQIFLHQTCKTLPSSYDFSSYRVSLLYRPVCRSDSSRLFVAFQGPDDGFGPSDAQNSGLSKLPLAHWKFQNLLMPSQKRVAVPQALASGEHNNPEIFNVRSFTSKAFRPSQMVPPSIRNFPWDKAYAGLNQRISDLLLILWTWIALPILVFIAINEIIFTVSVGKELFIPIGLLAGSVLAGTLTEMAITHCIDFQESVTQCHLLGIVVFFASMKIAGMKCLKCSFWASAFLVHFANGGLWQTIRFLVRWKRSKAEMADTEGVSSVVG